MSSESHYLRYLHKLHEHAATILEQHLAAQGMVQSHLDSLPHPVGVPIRSANDDEAGSDSVSPGI